jgi:hypothetical protein
MSESTVTADHASARKPAMGIFERLLTVWVALCITAGIALGQLVPAVFHVLGEATVAQVNIPVAVLVWLMIVPMLLKNLAALREVGQHWRGIPSTVGVNWLITPFSMALLAWIPCSARNVIGRLLTCRTNSAACNFIVHLRDPTPVRPAGDKGQSNVYTCAATELTGPAAAARFAPTAYRG